MQSKTCVVETMKRLTVQEFLEGYELGYIRDVVSIANRVYGKDPRGMANKEKRFEVVYCDIS